MDTLTSHQSDHKIRLNSEEIQQLEQLKTELEGMKNALENLNGKSQYEIAGRVREFQDKEHEIRQFLKKLGL